MRRIISITALLTIACLLQGQMIIVTKKKAGGCSDTVKDDSGSITTTNNLALGLTGGYLHGAVKFTAAASYDATKIKLAVRKVGSPTSTMTFWLVNDNSGDPEDNGDANSKGTSDSLAAGDVTTSYADYTLTLTSAKSITSSSVYWIKATITNTDDNSNYWQLERDTAGGAGSGLERSYDDAAWTSLDATGDLDWSTIACE